MRIVSIYSFSDYNLLFSIYRKVVSGLCVGLAETINKVGPAFLENSKLSS